MSVSSAYNEDIIRFQRQKKQQLEENLSSELMKLNRAQMQQDSSANLSDFAPTLNNRIMQ
jgi:hypothetical protein